MAQLLLAFQVPHAAGEAVEVCVLPPKRDVADTASISALSIGKAPARRWSSFCTAAPSPPPTQQRPTCAVVVGVLVARFFALLTLSATLALAGKLCPLRYQR
jgi:hypothetical protein